MKADVTKNSKNKIKPAKYSFQEQQQPFWDQWKPQLQSCLLWVCANYLSVFSLFFLPSLCISVIPGCTNRLHSLLVAAHVLPYWPLGHLLYWLKHEGIPALHCILFLPRTTTIGWGESSTETTASIMRGLLIAVTLSIGFVRNICRLVGSKMTKEIFFFFLKAFRWYWHWTFCGVVIESDFI